MPAFSKNKPTPSFLKSLSRVALGRYDVLLASLAINVLTLALPLVILQVYDRIIPNSAYNTFAYLVIGLMVAMILDAVLRALRTYITSWEGARFEHAIGRRAADRLLGSEIEAFEREPAGTHMDRMMSVESLRDFHSGQGLVAISDLPFVVLFLALIMAIDASLLVPPLVVVAIALVFAMVLGRALEKAVHERARLDDQRYNFVFQVLNAIHSVKGLGLEAQLQRQYEALLAPLAVAVKKLAFLSSLGRSLGSTFSNISMVSVAGYGSLLVLDGSLSSGSLVAATLLAGRAVQPLIRMIGVWVQSQNLKLSEHRLDTLLSLPQERRATQAHADVDFTAPICFQNVTVHRGNPDFPVLANVNLTINAGSIVALTGPMGGGKSVVLSLLAGLAHVDEGHLLFGDVDSAAIDFCALREHIGYAPQDAVLYRGTIRENLSGFMARERLPEALEIAHKLGLDEELARMPLGLDTHVGSAATTALPGSIQQEISLCRVLSKKPKLLLFDEANSVFDFEADRRLRRLLIEMRGETTIVMVTARPSLIALADAVVQVQRGVATCVEQTPFEAKTQPAPSAPPALDARSTEAPA